MTKAIIRSPLSALIDSLKGAGFEITMKNHCDGYIYLSIVSGFRICNYTQIYLHHSDFSALFQILNYMYRIQNKVIVEEDPYKNNVSGF